MSKRKADYDLPGAPRRRPASPDDGPEEGELSDEPGPSKAANDREKAFSDASDSPPQSSSIPLPFKSRAKAEPRPAPEVRPRIPASYDPPRAHGVYPQRGVYERWPDDRERAYDHHRSSYPAYNEYEYRDARYEPPRHGGDSYVPTYGSAGYDDRRARHYDSYVPDDPGYEHDRYRAEPPPIHHSPSQPHRLPKRPSPSPPRRRRDDTYRPRSPDLPPPPRDRHDSSYDDYSRPSAYDYLPPRPRSPTPPRAHPDDFDRSFRPIGEPSHILPPTEGKFRINAKPRASNATSRNILDPDVELSDPHPPPPSGPQPPQNGAYDFSNGAPPPPSEEPPPIPPFDPRVSAPAPAPPPSNGVPVAQQAEVSKGVPLIKATGTKQLRSAEAEQEAFGRSFVGVDKLSDFELLNKLGEGTFGEVHKAKRKTTGQLVAMKRIIMKNETEGVPITALREIKILKQLKHPNCVPLVTMVVQRQQRSVETSIYMVFPYMEHDLSGLLENQNVKLTLSQIKLYMLQLCEGVGYLHRNKILHRDLKSANLLIDNEGCLQIADFGLARPVDFVSKSRNDPDHYRERRSYTNSVVTRWYRSPELLLGSRKYEGWVDMWGVGCIFAEMFQRKPVLPGTSDSDQLTKIFQLCGSPTEDNFPGWNRYDPKTEFTPFWIPGPRRIQSVLPEQATSETIDFLDRLLTLDPMRRMTAFEALDHDYFWSDPMPADPKSLPRYDDSHEFNRRRAPQNAPQHAAVPMGSQIPPGQFYQPPPPQFFPPANGMGMGMGGGPGPQYPHFNQRNGPPSQNNRQGGGPPRQQHPRQSLPPGQSYPMPPNNMRAPPPLVYAPPPMEVQPPIVVLPPIRLGPGRPPPPMYGGMQQQPPPPPPQHNGNGGWEPAQRPDDPSRRDREWERGGGGGGGDRRDHRGPPPTPPRTNALNYG